VSVKCYSFMQCTETKCLFISAYWEDTFIITENTIWYFLWLYGNSTTD